MGLGWAYLLPGPDLGRHVHRRRHGCLPRRARLFKRTSTAFHDERMTDLSGGPTDVPGPVEVPFGTVLLEEIAFRAVLFSMLVRRFGLVWGVVVSSLLFGLWHILPSIGTHEQNPALGSVVGEGRRGQHPGRRPERPHDHGRRRALRRTAADLRAASWPRWASTGPRTASATPSRGCSSGPATVVGPGIARSVRRSGRRIGSAKRANRKAAESNDSRGIHAVR